MKLVVLDGYTLNPGDLDWKDLNDLADATVYDRTAQEDVVERCKEAELVLTNKTKITAEMISQLPRLKYIGELATGYDNVAVDAAAEKGIPVCNVPGYSTASVAQLTWAFILEFTYNTRKRSDDAKNGGWAASKDFCYGHEGLWELEGKCISLIGLGKIGSAVAKIANAFGMRVLANVRRPENYNVSYIEFASVEDCFKQADFLSLHVPLTERTRALVSVETLSLMKKSAFVINTGRGALINEHDLSKALHEGRIAGAAVDVLSVEPPSTGNLLLDNPQCIVTPHIAWATIEARSRLLKISIENIRGFINGSLQNVVNGVK